MRILDTAMSLGGVDSEMTFDGVRAPGATDVPLVFEFLYINMKEFVGQV